MVRLILSLLLVFAFAAQTLSQGPPVERGRVVASHSYWNTNTYGDEWIETQLIIEVGNGQQVVSTVQGGIIDDIELEIAGKRVPKPGQQIRLSHQNDRWEVEEEETTGDGGGVIGGGEGEFALNYPWPRLHVDWRLDPKYSELTPAATETDAAAAAAVWYNQTNVQFQMHYHGKVAEGTGVQKLDWANYVIFRPTINPSSSSALATAYWWWQAACASGCPRSLIDVDIVGWSGKVAWLKTGAICNGGLPGYDAFLREVLAHEFGHFAGLGHSAFSAATMYYRYAQCSTTQSSLHSDDIAGIRSLYPQVVASSTLPTSMN